MSSHHHLPVEAVVSGYRQRSAVVADGTEQVALCGRCADMLGGAGFFHEA